MENREKARKILSQKIPLEISRGIFILFVSSGIH